MSHHRKGVGVRVAFQDFWDIAGGLPLATNVGELRAVTLGFCLRRATGAAGRAWGGSTSGPSGCRGSYRQNNGLAYGSVTHGRLYGVGSWGTYVGSHRDAAGLTVKVIRAVCQRGSECGATRTVTQGQELLGDLRWVLRGATGLTVIIPTGRPRKASQEGRPGRLLRGCMSLGDLRWASTGATGLTVVSN